MKSFFAAIALVASFASAQSPTFAVQPVNTYLTNPLPVRGAPPAMVEVFIYDQTADDGFKVTLNYASPDGSQHTVTKLIERQGFVTYYCFEVTAVTANVAVYAMKFTGVAATSAAQ